jgi:prepilin-type N-terminal cleavage/methylation domain-containing protein
MRRGFTLLELMIVAAILGVVIAAIGACLAAGMRVWDATRKYGRGEPQFVLACAMMEKDIVNAFPFFAVSFSGTVDSVSMPALLRGGEPAAVAMLQPEPARIGTVRYLWLRDREAVGRKAWVYPSPEPPDAASEVVAPLVTSLRFRYMAAGDAAGVWRDTWTDQSNMPYCVQFEAELSPDTGGCRFERTVVRVVTNVVVR